MLKEIKRFIEESFPVREVSEEGAREKRIHDGTIGSLHIWWARRPLATSRATAFASLIDAPDDDKEKKEIRDFIVQLSKWENRDDSKILEQARKSILKANNGVAPRVLDPFGGGGSLPLEALRLGCESFSGEYYPVAVLLEKCTIEFPQKFGKEVKRKVRKEGSGRLVDEEQAVNPLLEDIKDWSKFLFDKTKAEVSKYYINPSDKNVISAFIWARTVPCLNPTCKTSIPLLKQYWLAKKKRRIALYPYAYKGEVKFRIVGDGHDTFPKGFDPDNGSVSRAKVNCPLCGTPMDEKDTRKLFNEGKDGERMIAVCYTIKGETGKKYRLANEGDVKLFLESLKELEKLCDDLKDDWGLNPIPDEEIKRVPVSFGVINVWVYGIKHWGELFNHRQLLTIITLIKNLKKMILDSKIEKEYLTVLASYIALGIDRLINRSSRINLWNVLAEKTEQVFMRNSIQMLWDYAEINPFGNQGWEMQFSYIIKAVENILTDTNAAIIKNESATNLDYPDAYFDAVITDPPYYDNVPYSYLSDFFYVWLKRMLGDLYPELFNTPLSPKTNEIVAYSQTDKDYSTGKTYFENGLKKSFQEIFRVLKPDGIAVIVYAHKSTSGWETVINALLDSGLVVTSSWPLNTEMAGRMRANESAALASSIYIIARKIDREQMEIYNNVQNELKQYLNKKLDNLWMEGISGPDFFISGIGSAIEVFGKYEKIIDYEGNIVRADRLLDDVREIVTNYSISQILHNGFSTEISELSRFYVLFRWNYGEAKVLFDDAKKLGLSCGIDIAENWGARGFIKKDKEFIRVLGPQNRKLDEIISSRELIDVLHSALLLWEKSNKRDMLALLQSTGYGKSEAFYRVAQAVSETLSNDSKEKKMLDGFLSGKERIKDEMKKEHLPSEPGLFD